MNNAYLPGGTDEEVNLKDLIVQEPQPGVKLPQASIKNRAATVSLLSGNAEEAIQGYQAMVAESEQGKDTLYQLTRRNVLASSQALDMKAVMSILSDPKLTLEQKRGVVTSVQGSQFLKDDKSLLLSNSLTAPSAGETEEQEASRISVADAVREIAQSINDVQGLVNAHGARLRDADARTAGEMAEAWVMPFGNTIVTGKIGNKQAEKDGVKQSIWEKIKSYALPGTTTANLRKKLESLPPEKRVEFAKSLVETISENSGILFTNENQFVQFDKAVNIFEQGGYGSFQEFLDNVSPLLDAVGIGQLLRGTKKVLKTPTPNVPQEEVIRFDNWEVIDPTLKRIEYNGVVRTENPASPAKVIQQSNPEQARNLHLAVVRSEEDTVADALYGTTKTDAVASDILPQATVPNGAVTTKVMDIQRNLREELNIPDELFDIITSSGALEYTRAEKAAARAHVVNNYTNVSGLTINDAMSSFAVDGGRIKIQATYGTPEGGFLRPEDALSQAKLALRSYGIRNDELELLKKEGLDHVPVKLEDVKGTEGNFYVRVNTTHVRCEKKLHRSCRSVGPNDH
jgi:hypothetical protein